MSIELHAENIVGLLNQFVPGGFTYNAPAPARAVPLYMAAAKGIVSHAYLSTVGAVSAIGGAMLVLPETVQNYFGGVVSSTSVQLGGGLANGTAAVLTNALVPAAQEAIKQTIPAAVEIFRQVFSTTTGAVTQAAGNQLKELASDPIGTVGAYCNLDAAANKKELFSWIYEESAAKLQELNATYAPTILEYSQEFKNKFSETISDKRNLDMLYVGIVGTVSLAMIAYTIRAIRKDQEAQLVAAARNLEALEREIAEVCQTNQAPEEAAHVEQPNHTN